MRRTIGRGAAAVKSQVRFGFALPRWAFFTVALCGLFLWVRWLAATRDKLARRRKPVVGEVASAEQPDLRGGSWGWFQGGSSLADEDADEDGEEDEGGEGEGEAAVATQPAVFAAPQPVIRIYESSPEDCVRDRGWETMKDARCYVKMHEAAMNQTGGDPLSTANLCWGYAPPPLPLYSAGYEGGDASVRVPPLPPGQEWAPLRRTDERVDGGGILFHMILLTGLGQQAPMTLVSWLATQVRMGVPRPCC